MKETHKIKLEKENDTRKKNQKNIINQINPTPRTIRTNIIPMTAARKNTGNIPV